MNVAILFSGQLRGFKHVVNNLKLNLISKFSTVDTFFYLSENNYYDIDNFKIVSSHAEYSAVRDYAKDLGVDSNKIIVKLSTNDKDIANTIIINLKEEKYKVEELRVQEEMLAQPIITKLDIYISRLKESGLDNIVKTPELKAAYRDWLKESGYDYTEDFESYETINATEI